MISLDAVMQVEFRRHIGAKRLRIAKQLHTLERRSSHGAFQRIMIIGLQ
jgi:hypothetical protein